MDFEEARRILRRLELPKSGGFEEVLFRLDELKDRAPADEARSFLRRQRPKIAKARGSRAA
jgi:hypothetical protein